MVKKHHSLREIGQGNISSCKAHYKTLAESLKTLLDEGFVELPKLSSQWVNRITQALNGDPFPLTQAIQRWEQQIDPLLRLKQRNPILEQWKKKEFEYIFNVHKILCFYSLICQIAFEE